MEKTRFCRQRTLATLLLTTCLALSGQAQTHVHVAKYKDNKAAAVSYTFDDGLLEHYTELFPQLQRFGIRATFAVCGGYIDRNERQLASGGTGTDSVVIQKPRMTWAMLREMGDQGQEITSHGWMHTNVKKIVGEALRFEIEHNDSVIFSHTGQFPRTFIYPGNAKTDERVAYCSRNRVGTRTRQISFGSKRSAEWMHEWVRELIRNGEWGITMTHGISRGYDHFADPQILFDHFADVQSLRDSLWIGTFHDVSAYETERDSTTFSLQETRKAITITPVCPLHRDLFDHPLTLVVDAIIQEARQSGRTLPIVYRGKTTLVSFIPQDGPIVLSKGKGHAVPVILTAGQSNTDGRAQNKDLPADIRRNGYQFCQWSYGSGSLSGAGRFSTYWPRIVHKTNPERFTYDAIVYWNLERTLQAPFFVIKESLGGTAIDTLCRSNSNFHWSASPDYLARTAASDKGGRSLLKAFTANIGACIDRQLSLLPQGYDIKLMLWHQGESDRTQADRYYENLKAMIAYVRHYLVEKTGRKRYARLPILIGGIPRESKQWSQGVEDAQRRLAREDKNVFYIDAAGAELGNDTLHFNAAGATTLGLRMFDCITAEHLLR